ncbi:phosphoribosylaminoimidazolesuccinocarboxamide synthase [Prochlorococcus marinus]|uniref:phosphoribosylaminoimidazolesuccinocarboxamide synthase n=1 Tax=Prochlorococcus marinus TaxID=1219 RepID=UPI0022B2BD2F|nr:phosphoribosylaminoimidazolesuccinocarboxamide synthase [Prochlorococcus marinus]
MQQSISSLLYEGKAKKIFTTQHQDECLVFFKNDATAFNGKKHAEVEGKGSLNCEISSLLFRFLESNGIQTHFLDNQENCWMLVQKVEIIPLEVVVRNIASGSLCKQTPIPPDKVLSCPLVDFYFKDDSLGDPLLTEARLDLLGLVSNDQRIELKRLALEVNGLLKDFFKKIDLLLVDFKLEMGLNQKGQLLIADEISPDTCRIWDLNAKDPQDRILDKDRFRKELGGVREGYSEILNRIKGFYKGRE